MLSFSGSSNWIKCPQALAGVFHDVVGSLQAILVARAML